MSLIDKFLLALRQLGVNSKVAAGTRAGSVALLDLIPGLEGAKHIARKVELPSVSSSLPFKLHNVATGNAVTRRLPKSNMRPSSPIRSRANRYRG